MQIRAVVVPLAAAVLLLPACSGGDEPESAPTTSSASASPSSSPSSSATTDEPSPSAEVTAPSPSDDPVPTPPPAETEGGGGPPPGSSSAVTTLDDDVFSGYAAAGRAVVAWDLSCEGESLVPSTAVAMGTARQALDDGQIAGDAGTARQVAVFGTVDEAVAAADELFALAQRCEGEQRQGDFVYGQVDVSPLEIGAQGVLVDAVFEDGESATAAFRRGNAVGLVGAFGAPEYPAGRSALRDARAGAQALFSQMESYER